VIYYADSHMKLLITKSKQYRLYHVKLFYRIVSYL